MLGWFNELCDLRGYDFADKVEHGKRYRVAHPRRLPPSEIESWLRLQKLDPSGFEVDVLMRLDAAYVEAMRKSAGKPKTALVPMSDSKGIGAMLKSVAPPMRKPPPERRKK